MDFTAESTMERVAFMAAVAPAFTEAAASVAVDLVVADTAKTQFLR